MSIPLFLLISVLAVVAGFVARRRFRGTLDREGPIVTDEVLRTILSEGELRALEDDEPLDEDAIRAAEDEFWEDDWGDDSEAWRG